MLLPGNPGAGAMDEALRVMPAVSPFFTRSPIHLHDRLPVIAAGLHQVARTKPRYSLDGQERQADRRHRQPVPSVRPPARKGRSNWLVAGRSVARWRRRKPRMSRRIADVAATGGRHSRSQGADRQGWRGRSSAGTARWPAAGQSQPCGCPGLQGCPATARPARRGRGRHHRGPTGGQPGGRDLEGSGGAHIRPRQRGFSVEVPFFPLRNRNTATKPVVIGFLAFSNRNIRVGCCGLKSARRPYFIAFVALLRLCTPLRGKYRSNASVNWSRR